MKDQLLEMRKRNLNPDCSESQAIFLQSLFMNEDFLICEGTGAGESFTTLKFLNHCSTLMHPMLKNIIVTNKRVQVETAYKNCLQAEAAVPHEELEKC